VLFALGEFAQMVMIFQGVVVRRRGRGQIGQPELMVALFDFKIVLRHVKHGGFAVGRHYGLPHADHADQPGRVQDLLL